MMKDEALFEVRESPLGGLGVFATRDLAVGHELFAEEPLVFAIALGFFNYCCRGCVACDVTNAAALPTACRCGARYCTPACAETDAVRHRAAECDWLERYREMRSVFAAQRLSKDDVLFIQSLVACVGRKASLLSLAAGVDRRGADADVNTLALVRAVSGLDVDEAELERLGRVEQANAMGWHVMTAAGALPVGRAVYERASRFNHSCRANVARLRDGRKMRFVVKRRTQAGEELCITYVAPGAAEKHRQLRQDFGFDCRCDGSDPSADEVCAECGGETVAGRCVFGHDRKISQK